MDEPQAPARPTREPTREPPPEPENLQRHEFYAKTWENGGHFAFASVYRRLINEVRWMRGAIYDHDQAHPECALMIATAPADISKKVS